MTALVTAGLPVFVRYIQWKNELQQEKAELRERELQAAHDTFDELSKTLSGLLFHMREGLYAAIYETRGERQTDSEDNERAEIWKNYRARAIEWEERRVRLLASVQECFGTDASKQMDEIDAYLRTLMRQVNATHYRRTGSKHYLSGDEGSPKYFQNMFFPLYRKTDAKVQYLNRYMLTAIQDQQVGALRGESTTTSLI